MSERTKTECTHWAKFVSLMKWNTQVAVAVVSQFAQNIFFISQSVANCRTTSITTAAFATTTAAAYLFSHFLKWPNDRTKRNAKKSNPTAVICHTNRKLPLLPVTVVSFVRFRPFDRIKPVYAVYVQFTFRIEWNTTTVLKIPFELFNMIPQ